MAVALSIIIYSSAHSFTTFDCNPTHTCILSSRYPVGFVSFADTQDPPPEDATTSSSTACASS